MSARARGRELPPPRRSCRIGLHCFLSSILVLLFSSAPSAFADPPSAGADDPPPLTESSAPAAEAQIRELLALQVEAWNEGDLEAFMAAYELSPELVFASGDQVSYGWRTTLERYQMRYNEPQQMGRLAFELLQVDLLGSAYAKVLGRWRLTREEDSPHGLFTLILLQRDGAWRIIHDHTSSADE